jgi:hypothetical protein
MNCRQAHQAHQQFNDYSYLHISSCIRSVASHSISWLPIAASYSERKWNSTKSLSFLLRSNCQPPFKSKSASNEIPNSLRVASYLISTIRLGRYLLICTPGNPSCNLLKWHFRDKIWIVQCDEVNNSNLETNDHIFILASQLVEELAVSYSKTLFYSSQTPYFSSNPIPIITILFYTQLHHLKLIFIDTHCDNYSSKFWD